MFARPDLIQVFPEMLGVSASVNETRSSEPPSPTAEAGYSARELRNVVSPSSPDLQGLHLLASCATKKWSLLVSQTKADWFDATLPPNDRSYPVEMPLARSPPRLVRTPVTKLLSDNLTLECSGDEKCVCPVCRG